MNLMHVGRPPLRSYLTAGMGAKIFSQTSLQLGQSWPLDDQAAHGIAPIHVNMGLVAKQHCPGALHVSILTSKKTWRTRNAVRSSNGDYEKTTQHFAMMSASDLFVGYMRSSMAS